MVSFGRVLIVAAMLFASGCGIDTNQPTATTAQRGSTTVATAPGVATAAAVGVTGAGVVGEAAIADNFDPAGGIIPIGRPAPVETNPQLGAFRMFCTGGQIATDDPLFYPGQPGVSHLHQFFGNTGTNASSNYQSLRTSGGTTCGQSSTPFNRSAYWFPAMLDGVGNVVKPDFIKLYYKRNASADPLCSQANTPSLGQCVDLPNGIRYAFGYNMNTGEGFANSNVVFYSCVPSEDGTVSNGTATGRYWNLAEVAAAGCPIGAQVVIAANSPNCWDGMNLDSADHRSHMAYASGPYFAAQQWRACVGPGAVPGHPYMMPNMEVLIQFTVDANLAKWHLSSDEMVPGAIPGSTFHVDYWEAWSPTIKARWHAACINQALSCGGAALDNTFNGGIGGAIAGGDTPWPNGFPKHQLVALSSIAGTVGPTPSQPPTSPSVPAPTPAPTPATQVCPDGSVIPLTQACPQPLLVSKPGKGVGRKK